MVCEQFKRQERKLRGGLVGYNLSTAAEEHVVLSFNQESMITATDSEHQSEIIDRVTAIASFTLRLHDISGRLQDYM